MENVEEVLAGNNLLSSPKLRTEPAKEKVECNVRLPVGLAGDLRLKHCTAGTDPVHMSVHRAPLEIVRR